MSVEPLRRLSEQGELWPVSLVARRGGVRREYLYKDFRRRYPEAFCSVDGYLFVRVSVLLNLCSRRRPGVLA